MALYEQISIRDCILQIPVTGTCYPNRSSADNLENTEIQNNSLH